MSTATERVLRIDCRVSGGRKRRDFADIYLSSSQLDADGSELPAGVPTRAGPRVDRSSSSTS